MLDIELDASVILDEPVSEDDASLLSTLETQISSATVEKTVTEKPKHARVHNIVQNSQTRISPRVPVLQSERVLRARAGCDG